MIFRKRTRQDRKDRKRETGRRRLANLMSRSPRVETLEERRLLAVVAQPTLNLENADDTGMMNLDNVTSGDPLLTGGVMDFFLTADAGSSVVIRDGNTVINDQITVSTLYLSLDDSTTLPGGVEVDNEDIVAFDGTNFSLFFNGSEVGLSSAQLDALSVTAANEILLSFTTAEIVPGIGTVQGSDIVKFIPTQTGEDTAGTFSLFFNGSDVGLNSSDDENIDAFDLHSDGRLIISTMGDFSVPGLTGHEEDLIAFTPDTPGDYSSGTWAMFVDGSDVEIAGEDVDAVALNSTGEIHLHLSTTNEFDVTGLVGEEEDAFTFLPTQLGDDTTGTYSPTLLFDGSLYGLTGNDVTGIDLSLSGGTPIANPADFDTLDAADGAIDGIAKVRIDFNAVQAAHFIPLQGDHLLSVEAYDPNDNDSEQSEQLLVTIDTIAPAATVPALAETSESGNPEDSDTFSDGKTNKMQPAFVGIAEANAKVRVYADGVLVGQSVATSQGDWEITVEPLVDGEYEISTEVEDLAGNITVGPDIDVIIDSTAPQRPTLDLKASEDSGMSDIDNVTNDSPPEVLFTLTSESAMGTTVVIKDGNTVIFGPIEFASIPGQADNQATIGLDLDEGTHLLSAESTDMAGNISHQSEELVVVIDRTKPGAATVSLAATSDSGQTGDNKTNKMQPVLVGTAEENAKVRVYADGVLVGQTVATSDGDWEITVEPLIDGTYEITTEVEDLAGNVKHGTGFDLTVDSTMSQRPTLDLETSDDTGMSNLDNVTFGDPDLNPGVMDFYLTADAGTTVLIKDGNTVINDQVSAGAVATTIYLSFNSVTDLPGLTGVANEDIVAFDGTNFSSSLMVLTLILSVRNWMPWLSSMTTRFYFRSIPSSSLLGSVWWKSRILSSSRPRNWAITRPGRLSCFSAAAMWGSRELGPMLRSRLRPKISMLLTCMTMAG